MRARGSIDAGEQAIGNRMRVIVDDSNTTQGRIA
jgi:hypothetical protein